MYLLKKVFQLREHAHPDQEKPFLEHLEDLRTMIFRMAVTLTLAMIVCFTFQEHLMAILRRPVEQVWKIQLEEKLPQSTHDAPRPVDVHTWEAAVAVEHAAQGLPADQRDRLYESLGDENLHFHARAAGLLRALQVVPAESRDAFLAAVEPSAEMQKQVRYLLTTSPDTENSNRGNVRMMSALKPTETFMLSMKLSFFAGIVLSFPLLLLFLLQFILPGLHATEKKVLWPAMAIGFGLFLLGVAFAYFAVLPRALLFFSEWGGDLGVSNDWRIGEYISFATQFTLLFGLSFELPVVVMIFVKLGLLGYETMANTRRYAIVAIFVLAAVLTPTPDIFTMCLMATPMLILYEICIWLAYFDRKKRRQQEADEERERMDRLLSPVSAAAAEDVAEWEEASPRYDPEGETPQSGDDGWGPEFEQQDPHPGSGDPELPDPGEEPRPGS